VLFDIEILWSYILAQNSNPHLLEGYTVNHQNAPQNMDESPDYPRPSGRQGVDPTLLSLDVLVEVTKGSIGISLVLPGGLLHGLLVSSVEWHNNWFESLAEAGKGGTLAHNILKSMFDSSGRLTTEGALVDHDEHYLFIKDGYFVTGNNQRGPMPWRIRLTSVVAWSIGERQPQV
jgi:hypothetical protein